MIVARKKSTKPKKQKYGKYFLASEAPGDEDELVPGSPDRINMKVVSVRPDNRQRSDFSTVADTENQQPEDNDLPDVVPQNQDNTDGGVGDDTTTDTDTDTTDYTQTPDTQATDTDNTDGEDRTDYTQDDNTDGNNNNDQNDTGMVNAEPDIDPEPDDQTDYTQVDSTPGDDNNDNDDTDNNADDKSTNQRPGIDFDSMRKYNLYKEYSRLRNTVNTYIEKLEASMSDDYESNQVLKTATEKMREVYDLLSDYMLMKFEACNYVQNMLFYQQQIATINLIFKLLKTVKPKSDTA